MKSPIIPGSKFLLDGTTEVIVLKPSTRSNSSYTVEIPGRSIEIVSTDRLMRITQPIQKTIIDDIFDYEQ
ncbi:hypothetical protein D4L85_16445 [Chryseolinea soli]|uniref:Uncharacterized protein n=1 Tax=Chryseolinea soli TaxID=2321403 RepID=A0A385SNX7_9BACT|nr:hypothetical protein D4L85_16445 [Chryseolinea soli]